MDIIDRKTACAAGQRYFYTNVPCKNGHVTMRYVCSGVCILCAKNDQARYRNDPDFRQKKLERGRDYYIANKDKISARAKQWKIVNPEKYIKKSRDYHNSIKGRARKLFSAAKKRSVVKNYEIDITVDWIESRLTKGTCEITGIPFIFVTGIKNYRSPYAPSLDRKDSSKGYTRDNCRVILWALNMGFANWGQEIYLEIARRLAKFDL